MLFLVSKNICLVSYIWNNILISFILSLKSELLELECVPEPPGDLVEMHVGVAWSPRFCISNKLPGDADAAGPLTTLCIARLQLMATPSVSAFC